MPAYKYQHCCSCCCCLLAAAAKRGFTRLAYFTRSFVTYTHTHTFHVYKYFFISVRIFCVYFYFTLYSSYFEWSIRNIWNRKDINWNEHVSFREQMHIIVVKIACFSPYYFWYFIIFIKNREMRIIIESFETWEMTLKNKNQVVTAVHFISF